MTGMLPLPENPHEDSKSKSSSHRQGGQGFQIPSIEELAELLMKLNGLMMLGIIPPAQAAISLRIFQSLLNTQMKRTAAERPGLSQETLAEIYRRDPAMVNLLEPFLTEDQVKWVMSEGKEDPGEQA